VLTLALLRHLDQDDLWLNANKRTAAALALQFLTYNGVGSGSRVGWPRAGLRSDSQIASGS
jgi:hypothetical protein